MTYLEFISKFEIYDSYHEAQKKGFEAHHILPRALQKGNETLDDRCVRLTPYEHIYAHYLLALENEDAIRVFFFMVNRNKFKLSDIEKVTLEDLEHWAALRKEGREKASDARKAYFSDPKNRQKTSEITSSSWADPEYRQKQSVSHKGKIWVTDGVINTLVPKDEPIPEGWRLGMKPVISGKGKYGHPHTPESRQKMSEERKGKIWINNGKINRHISKDASIPSGWSLGRKSGDVKKGTIWVTNGIERKRIPEGSPIPEGFMKGRKFKTA